MAETIQATQSDPAPLPYRMPREKFERAIGVLKASPRNVQALDVALGSDRPFILRSLVLLGLATTALELTPAGRKVAFSEGADREQTIARVLMEFEPYKLVIRDAIRRRAKSITAKEAASIWGQHLYGVKEEARLTAAIVLLSLLEAAGLGKYLLGRRGAPSRVDLVDNFQELVTAAYSSDLGEPEGVQSGHEGQAGKDAPKPPNGGVIDPPKEGVIIHRFPLRQGLMVAVELPEDLTSRDVERLTRWLSTLPMEKTE